MLEQGEREMDRKVVSLAQKKAQELQECMGRAGSYAEGRELQMQYKAEMAEASAALGAERHAHRRKLEVRLEGRKSRHSQRMDKDVDTKPATATASVTRTTSTTSMALLAKITVHEQQVRHYLKHHHRDDLLPVCEDVLRPSQGHDADDQKKDTSTSGVGVDEASPRGLPLPPPPRAEPDRSPSHERGGGHTHESEQRGAPPPPLVASTSDAKVRPRARPRPSGSAQERGPPRGWVTHAEQNAAAEASAAGNRAGAATKVVTVDDREAQPPGDSLSLEAYLGLAAARRNLSGSRRKVKVTPKMRQEWAKQGKLLEF